MTMTHVGVFRYPFSSDQEIAELDWEVYLRETASLIVQQQSPRRCAN